MSSPVGRIVKLAGMLFMAVWLIVAIVLSSFGISIQANLHTFMILLAVGVITTGIVLERLKL